MEISDRIRQLIENKGVTSYKISVDTGISQAMLSRILSGNTKKPQCSTVKILAKYFNVSPEWLLTGEGDMHTTPEQNAPFYDSMSLTIQVLNEQLKVKDAQIAKLHHLLEMKLKGDAYADVASVDVG